MYKIKGCPRCNAGDVFADSDQYGAYEQCFQCGWMSYGGKRLTQEEARAEKKEVTGAGGKERRGRR
jgi:hypothetical protein